MKYACVVSVGCGVFHADELGDFSIQKYFSRLGTHTLQMYKFFSELKNLLKLLGNAVSYIIVRHRSRPKDLLSETAVRDLGISLEPKGPGKCNKMVELIL